MIPALRRVGHFDVPGAMQRVLAQLENNVALVIEALRTQARIRWDVRHLESVDSPFTAAHGQLLLCDTTDGDVTVRLPAASAAGMGKGIAWREIAGGNDVVAKPISGSIDGGSSATFTSASGVWEDCGPVYGWRSF